MRRADRGPRLGAVVAVMCVSTVLAALTAPSGAAFSASSGGDAAFGAAMLDPVQCSRSNADARAPTAVSWT